MAAYDAMSGVLTMMTVGKCWQGACDAEWEEVSKTVAAADAVALKGLLRQYADAVSDNDVPRMAAISKAIGIERWTYQSGDEQQRRVGRDERGRFTRTVVVGRMAEGPKESKRRSREARDKTLVNTSGMSAYNRRLVAQQDATGRVMPSDRQAELELQATSGVTDPQELARRKQQVVEQVRRERERTNALLRGVNSFQNELYELFRDNAADIRIIAEAPGVPGAQPVSLRAGEPINQDVAELAMNAAQTARDNEDGLRLQFEAPAGAPQELGDQIARFNAMRSVGVSPQQAFQNMDRAAFSSYGPGLAQAAEQYQESSPGYGRMKSAFNTLSSAGRAMMGLPFPQAAAAGMGLQALGGAGQAIPESVYDSARTMNYRYRGRKRSDLLGMQQYQSSKFASDLRKLSADPRLTPEVWQQFSQYYDNAAAAVMRDAKETARQGAGGRSKSSAWAPAWEHARMTMPGSVAPVAVANKVNRDVSVISLMPLVPPDSRTAALQLKSDNAPPSTGVLIPRGGGAGMLTYTGVGDDTYVPFSAKAMRKMKDGQYVRTRVLGGLTPEDIRTLVSTGARSATVVSGSGVFTISMQQGSGRDRLTTPEVAAMAERYDRILGEVARGKQYVVDLSAEEKNQIEASLQLQGLDPTSDDYSKRLEAAYDKRRRERERLSPADVEKLRSDAMAEAERQMPRGRPQDVQAVADEIFEQLESEAKESLVRKFSLNHDGYRFALAALREQYPDLITSVSAETLRDYVDDRGFNAWMPKASVALRNRKYANDSVLVPTGSQRAATAAARQQAEAPAGDQGGSGAAGTGGDGAASGASTRPSGSSGGSASGGSSPSVAGGGGTQTDSNSAVAGLRTNNGGLRYQLEQMKDTALPQVERAVFEGNGVPGLTVANPDVTLAEFTSADDFEKLVRRQNSSELVNTLGLSSGGRNLNIRMQSTHPEMIANRQSMAEAAKTSAGLTAAMALAFEDQAWQHAANEFGEALKPNVRRQFQQYVDGAVSVEMMDQVPVGYGVFDRGMGFTVPRAVDSVLTSNIDTGGLPAALSAYEQYVTADLAGDYGDRKAMGGALKQILEENRFGARKIAHGNVDSLDMSLDGEVFGTQGLSTLQLLAAQSLLFSALDSADFTQLSAGDIGLDKLFVGSGDYTSSKSAFEAAKNTARKRWANWFGDQYMRKLLGGGGADPKVATVSGGVVVDPTVLSKSHQPANQMPVRVPRSLPPRVPTLHRLNRV